MNQNECAQTSIKMRRKFGAVVAYYGQQVQPLDVIWGRKYRSSCVQGGPVASAKEGAKGAENGVQGTVEGSSA